ncbi:hypothetical protein, partial [Pseudomonas sp. MD195_PC81_125]|uniref:hypothetical protein n=1 Tax=Pseudomonas sp. MD195_PC81_125 TaxID=2741560 RepID=UPI001C70C3B0
SDQFLTETPSDCGGWLAAKAASTADQFLTKHRSTVELACSEGGLTADQFLTENTQSHVGTGLPAMAACQPTNF